MTSRFRITAGKFSAYVQAANAAEALTCFRQLWPGRGLAIIRPISDSEPCKACKGERVPRAGSCPACGRREALP